MKKQGEKKSPEKGLCGSYSTEMLTPAPNISLLTPQLFKATVRGLRVIAK